MVLWAVVFTIRRRSSQLGAATVLAFKAFAFRWVSADNIGLLVGVWLLTKGASHWGDYVGYLTCGTLILSLTILHMVAGRAR